MRVWILTKTSGTYENLRFNQVATQLGIDLTFVCPGDFDLVVTKEGAKGVLLGGVPTELPDCLIPRMGAGTTYFGLAVIRHLENLGVFVLNPSRSIETAKDKLATVQALVASNVPVPKTVLAKFPLNLEVVEKELSFPIIVKVVSGSRGKGVYLCETISQLDDLINLVKIFHDPTILIVFQEYVSSRAGQDIRVIVLDGEPIGAMLRTAKDGQFKANFSAGGTVAPYDLDPEIRMLATEAVRLLNLDIAGVDILFDEFHYKVCEVNSSPGFQGFESATGISVPHAIFEHIASHLGGSLRITRQQPANCALESAN